MILEQPANPPPYVFVDFDEWETPRFAWPCETPGTVRYVLAPEGSRVLDPEMAQVFDDWLHAEPEPWVTLTEATFDFRGGAS